MGSESYKGARCVVTGGLGFMGSNLVHELSKLRAEIAVIDSLIDGLGGNPFNLRGLSRRPKIALKDLRTEEITQFVSEADFVFHYAGLGSHSKSQRKPLLDIELNVTSTLRVLEAIRKSKSNPALIYAGTRGQIGPVKKMVDESYQELPVSVYGVSKSAAEKYCMVYSRLYGLKVISLRFANVYGPRNQMKHSLMGILNWFIRLALENRTIEVWDGRQKRDFLYVDDATNAALMAGQKKSAYGEAFFVCSSKPLPILEAAKAVIDIAGSGSLERIAYPYSQKGLEVGDVLISNEKAKKQLGWSPKIALRDGISKTIEFYKNNLLHYV